MALHDQMSSEYPGNKSTYYYIFFLAQNMHYFAIKEVLLQSICYLKPLCLELRPSLIKLCYTIICQIFYHLYVMLL